MLKGKYIGSDKVCSLNKEYTYFYFLMDQIIIMYLDLITPMHILDVSTVTGFISLKKRIPF